MSGAQGYYHTEQHCQTGFAGSSVTMLSCRPGGRQGLGGLLSIRLRSSLVMVSGCWPLRA